MKKFVVATCLTLLATSVDAQDWSTEFEEITERESRYEIALPKETGLTLPQIIRAVASDRNIGHRREYWTWDTGYADFYVLEKSYYIPIEGKGYFIDYIAGEFPEVPKLHKRDIKRGTNKLGRFYYVEVPSEDSTCFFFFQNLPYLGAAGYEEPPVSAARGNIHAYDCADLPATTSDEHEEMMLTFARGLRRNLQKAAYVRGSTDARTLPIGARADFESYSGQLHYKAFAISVSDAEGEAAWGWSWIQQNPELAVESALRECQEEADSECQLYALGDIIVAAISDEQIESALQVYRLKTGATLDDIGVR